jgi:hypothetical protein
VALQLTAPGLAEFVKFLPNLRLGQVVIERLVFLLPLFVALLAIPILVDNKALGLPRWLRWALRLWVCPLALAGLSPVWTPTILVDPEFRLQTILGGGAVVLTVVTPLLKNLPLKPLLVLYVIAAVAALILPFWQFSLIQADMMQVYHEPVALGWGWWLTVLGLIISLITGVYLALVRGNPIDYVPLLLIGQK